MFDMMVGHGIGRHHPAHAPAAHRAPRRTADSSPDNALAAGQFDEDIPRIFNDAVIGLNLEGLVAKRDDCI
ncbi:hypothetical protein [Variovorax sp. J31P179]|uniref:hypothetical protein n=1 Tax=Variovorax sp. J31P179 TaxID=3053508 RepID=UPI002575CECE|nr:hypothetical protein [Variovorax sp. J31P179]